MARNAISLSLYALVLGSEVSVDLPASGDPRVGGKPFRGPFKLRWREDTEKDGQIIRVQRSKQVSDTETARILVQKVRTSLECGEAPKEVPRHVPSVASLDDVSLAFMKARKADGKSEGTLTVYRSSMARIFSTLRSLLKLGADQPVPVSCLSLALGSELRTIWKNEDERTKDRRAASPWRRYDLTLLLFKVWQFASSHSYAGVPSVPASGVEFHGPAPVRGAVGYAPTLQECDAVIRRAYDASEQAGDVLSGLRYTGLRVDQILSIKRCDVDTVRSELIVMNGKSAREKADMRRIPVNRGLLDLWSNRLGKAAPGDYLFPAYRGVGHATIDEADVTKCWEAAVTAGEVRPGVHNPPQRRKGRPNHAFRAAFMAHLESLEVEVEGVGTVRVVDDKSIDFLVGHAASSTRDRSYVPASPQRLRRAVDALPVINWGTVEEDSNVVPLHR